jgi:phospholipid/cholesterol/gamma-HCH transport system substrate-binding protein
MPDKYKKDISIEVLVGLFMFIILIALGIFTIVLSRQNFLQKTYPIVVVFENVGGLREGDHVFLRGTQVGVVKSTHLVSNHVEVRTDLDVPVAFRKGYKVEIVASSMLGGKLMKIQAGPLSAELIPANEVIHGDLPVDILDELSVAVAGIRAVTDKIAAGEGTVGKLLKDDVMYEEMTAMMANLNRVSEDLANGKGTLGKLLSGEDRMYTDLQEMVDNLKQVSERVANGEGTLGKLLAKDDVLYQDIQTSFASLREITETISAGGGTLGKLVEDDQLYVEAEKLLGELRATIDDMRETSPVTTFSTIFFGAF